MQKVKYILASLIILTVLVSNAQFYHTDFGHNRIQYKNFEWYYYSTNNFEVYYYPGGQEYADEALDFLENEFSEITDQLGYAPYTKMKIFIYNSVEDLQQSNIGIGGEVFTIGGKTDFVKLQVEMAHPGTSIEFKNELVMKLSDVLINDMMYGGSLAEIFQNAYLLTLPEWFIGGASRYLAYGWSAEMDDYVRDYLGRRKINKLVKIKDEAAELVGQSIWNYIAIKYGKSNISNILNLTRIIRNEENSITSTLGIGFKQFLSDWQNYYLMQKEEIEVSYIAPQKDNRIASYKSADVKINAAKTNSDGTYTAYSYNKNGKWSVNVVNLETNQEQTVVSGGYLVNDQEINYHLPLLDWKDNENIGVIFFKRGFLYLNVYNIESGERTQKPLTRFRQIESFTFNDNGKLVIISGDVDGKSDLFLISMRRNAVRRITNDSFDDIDPVFIPGTAALVFSSNRTADSLNVKGPSLEEASNNYNLFLYDLDTTSNSYYRLTNTFSVDRKPIAKNQYFIYYLSDQKGINNLYRYSLLDSTFTQVTNYQYSIQDYDLSFDPDRLTYIMLDKGKSRVYQEANIDLANSIFTPQTGRKRLEQARFVAKRLPKRNIEPQKVAPDSARVFSKIDSLILPESFFFKDDKKEEVARDDFKEVGNFIDTDNYVFEDEVRSTYRPESFFTSYRKFETKSRVIGPLNYEPRFSFNNLITSAAVDPIRGFSIYIETSINDILENHRLIGGVLSSTDFKSGDIFAEYQYLKYWMDFHVRFERQVYLPIVEQEENLIQKYSLNTFEITAAVPLTNTFRLEASPFVSFTDFRNLQIDAISQNASGLDMAPNSGRSYGGLKVGAIYDNTIEKGFNIYHGTRALVEYKQLVGLSGNVQGFSKFNLDVRHYQKVHRTLTLASRLFYGRSMGQNKQNYLLGGMQNWIFNQVEDQGENDPLSFENDRDNTDVVFTEFVTNLRGFDFNEVYGNNALVFNAELRWPIFRYFSNGPISSNFLRNFQLVGFYDLGTAWSGKAPFNSENSALTKEYRVEGSTFSADLAVFQNPWLAGYGFGLRTVLMGYYLKVDLARPIQDGKIGDTRFYFTLGLDF
ncbi:MAG: hypothetical protein ACI9A7_000642 [Cyclobacteriaceae bacterium]|jgi:hypothetical protein